MKKYVIYTGIFGDYDHLIEPDISLLDNVDLICFTNNPKLRSKVWDIRIVDEPNISDHMLNRKIKVLPHFYLSNYDYSLYVDGNIFLKKDFEDFFESYCDSKLLMALPIHLDRKCLYEEALVCIQQKKDNESLIRKQMTHYEEDGFPRKYGLYENNILLRKHNDPLICTIMEKWWHELNTWSKRDQLSLCYVFWKNNFSPKLIKESSRIRNPYFDIVLHSNYKKMPFIKRMIVLVDMKKHKSLSFKMFYLFVTAMRKINKWTKFNGRK